jgi:hypothetical protein
MKNNTHDVHNEQGENITIYEKHDLWQSPAEPSEWDQGVARRYYIYLDKRPNQLDLII